MAIEPVLITFPSDDAAFSIFVRTTRNELVAQGDTTSAGLEAALRRHHPRAKVVTAQQTEAGADAWHVYRNVDDPSGATARWVPPPPLPPPPEPHRSRRADYPTVSDGMGGAAITFVLALVFELVIPLIKQLLWILRLRRARRRNRP